jgi:lactate permease
MDLRLDNNKQRWIMVWQQIYDPFGNPLISTLMAAVPVVVMLAALAFFTSRRTWPPCSPWLRPC